ncbi:hypothetical protein [Phenylobacterium sp.]|uniref:SMP-30/gluconolactonase/LRE family protein n=1 Tax=Phenylobacterium sp. TaxID=1871053 RepID=UPI0025DC02BD|nr:hypothetical protein [Phenylobacterium sp.]
MRGAAIILLATTLTAGAAIAAPSVRLEPLWSLEGFEDPESVAVSADGKTLFVANVAGEGDAVDGRGFISRVSRDGKLLQKEWVGGMDGPKGGVVAGDRLYVSDITRLVEIDIPTGRIVGRYPAPDAKFLNDVAVAPDGTVLVADSGGAKIFALKAGVMVDWAAEPLLRAINGLLPEPDRLVITTMAGKLLAMDWKSHAITVLADGIGQGDGVARLDNGHYLVSEWPGRLFEFAPGGAIDTLIDSRQAGTYINDFIRLGDVLLVPNWKPGRLNAYRIAPSRP